MYSLFLNKSLILSKSHLRRRPGRARWSTAGCSPDGWSDGGLSHEPNGRIDRKKSRWISAWGRAARNLWGVQGHVFLSTSSAVERWWSSQYWYAVVQSITWTYLWRPVSFLFLSMWCIILFDKSDEGCELLWCRVILSIRCLCREVFFQCPLYVECRSWLTWVWVWSRASISIHRFRVSRCVVLVFHIP